LEGDLVKLNPTLQKVEDRLEVFFSSPKAELWTRYAALVFAGEALAYSAGYNGFIGLLALGPPVFLAIGFLIKLQKKSEAKLPQVQSAPQPTPKKNSLVLPPE
jgi:hypothetical protein